MRIILVRHGQPEFNTRIWLRGESVKSALMQYRDSRVITASSDNQPYQQLVNGYCISSKLSRARDSMNLCRCAQAEVSELLNEAELPYPNNLFVRLPWSVLIVICRLAWLFGYRSNAAGISRDKDRAKKASKLLMDKASEHETVCVFAHGITNRLIARELKKHGWKIQSKTGDGFWSSTTLIVG